jgi:hypothetical protein
MVHLQLFLSMRYLLNLLCIFLYISHPVKGQLNNLIITEEQNNRWFDSLSSLSLENKLTAISNRILSDTAVFVRNFYNDRIRVNDQPGDRVYGHSKPVIVINNQQAIVIKNETATAKIHALCHLLTPKYITAILLLIGNKPSTLAIYGQQGEGGIILLTVAQKRILKKLKALKI